MGIAKDAPPGGIVVEIAGREHVLLLRNAEIERFEQRHDPLGAFEMMRRFIDGRPQVRHCRDLVALGLVGGGMSNRAADDLVGGLGPEHDLALRQHANDVLFRAFLPAPSADAGPKDGGDGSPLPETEATTTADGTSPNAFETSPPSASAPSTSAP